MPRSIVLLALLALAAIGAFLLSLAIVDGSYQQLGTGGCVLLGSSLIAAAIIARTPPT